MLSCYLKLILDDLSVIAKQICYYRVIPRIQPVYVVDVASAIIAALKDDGSSMGKTYELGGPEIYTIHELVCLHTSSFLKICHSSLFVYFPEMIIICLHYCRQNSCMTQFVNGLAM